MEAHAGTIRIPGGTATKPRRRRLSLYLANARARRHARAVRRYTPGTHRAPASLPGSEHSHLILPPKAY